MMGSPEAPAKAGLRRSGIVHPSSVTTSIRSSADAMVGARNGSRRPGLSAPQIMDCARPLHAAGGASGGASTTVWASAHLSGGTLTALLVCSTEGRMGRVADAQLNKMEPDRIRRRFHHDNFHTPGKSTPAFALQTTRPIRPSERATLMTRCVLHVPTKSKKVSIFE